MRGFDGVGMNQNLQLLRIVLTAILLLSTTAIQAEPKSPDAGLQQVLRKAQGVVRQLSQEKAELQAEKAAWLTEKANLENRLKTLEASANRLPELQGQVERYQGDLQKTRDDLESQRNQAQERHQSLLKKHQEVLAKAKEIRADNALLVQAVQEREQWIQECGQRNQSLVQVNKEVVKKYKDKSFWQELSELEPFTGIGSVRSESAAEDYRYKIQHLKATAFNGQEPIPSPPPSADTRDEDEAGDP
jgi:chromosome segregation ATPase